MEIFDKKIDELELSMRAQNALQIDNVKKIGDLVQREEYELKRVPNIGKKTIKEIKDALSIVGLELGMDRSNDNIYYFENMKGGKTMENVNVAFIVLEVEEQKMSSEPYKVVCNIVGTFKNLEDARKCKDAKDTLESITPNPYDWCKKQFKVQQIFYKSFVQADKSA